ncbi:C1GALT1-specific chaperone 1-like isoform X2 [Phymastichus coffea]|uniref:C1GALT1-specific chaperone 1-like isoform X2 n=1 Tax=Phymastichus coffea TaxID=108790 RepID=UPI00273B7FCB|nr:C1GALT1-specific chaperone 1-like isoform X2 [Phymastichus coffea]
MNILLRPKVVFVIGFLFGFLSVFIYKYVNSIIESPKLHKSSLKIVWTFLENWSESAKNYEAWCQNQNVKLSELNLDEYAYGAQSINHSDVKKLVLESKWLRTKVPITCVVFVEKLKLVATITDTWGKHCNKLLFFSRNLSDSNFSVINLGIKYTSAWQFLCEIMNYIWKRRNEIPLNWIIFIKDDTIVVPENLQYNLAALNYMEPYYLGHAIVLWGTPYNVAQAGYVLSYESLRRVIKLFNTSKKCAAGGKYWKNEDYYLGKHLGSLGVHPSDTRDSENKTTFHGYPLNVLLWGIAKPGAYYSRAIYEPNSKCCSSRTVTFSNGDAEKMRTINYLLYHLNTFESGIYGNKPAPTPIPEDKVIILGMQEIITYSM